MRDARNRHSDTGDPRDFGPLGPRERRCDGQPRCRSPSNSIRPHRACRPSTTSASEPLCGERLVPITESQDIWQLPARILPKQLLRYVTAPDDPSGPSLPARGGPATPMIHEDLVERFAAFFSRPPSTIYELGSPWRSCGRALGAASPRRAVIAVECNPDTVATVRRRLVDVPDALAVDLAVTDFNGTTTFHKIDPLRTVTTWTDGNPGASSLFVASGKYPIEQYVQIPVRVRAGRLDCLIDAETIPPPELLWIDLAGRRAGRPAWSRKTPEPSGDRVRGAVVLGHLRRATSGTGRHPVPPGCRLRDRGGSLEGAFQCDALFVNVRRLGPMDRYRAFMRVWASGAEPVLPGDPYGRRTGLARGQTDEHGSRTRPPSRGSPRSPRSASATALSRVVGRARRARRPPQSSQSSWTDRRITRRASSLMCAASNTFIPGSSPGPS